jgi:MATE family multidrug resistance protein
MTTAILSLPIAEWFFHCAPLLRNFVDERLVDPVSAFLPLSLLFSVPSIVTICLTRFAQAQCEPNIGLLASFIGLLSFVVFLAVFQPLEIYTLVVTLAASNVLSLVASVLLCVDSVQMRCSLRPERWEEVLSGPEVLRLFRVAIPSFLLGSADMWGFEALTILCARMGAVEVSTWGILLTLLEILFAPFIGLQFSSCVRVGNSIGAGKVNEARCLTTAMWLTTLVAGTVSALTLGWLTPTLFATLAKDAATQKLGASLSLPAAIFFFMDVLFFVPQGVFRGIGKQLVSTIIVVIGMWCCGVPLAHRASSVWQQGVAGILFSASLGMGLTVPLHAYYLHAIADWEQCSKDIARQQHRDSGQP